MHRRPGFKDRVLSAFALALAALVVLVSKPALANEANFDDIEALFKSDEAVPAAPVPGQTKADDSASAAKPGQINDVSDLSRLQPFDDVAVIQRRFLPKSQRFELNLGPALNLNDAFFFSAGGALRLGYYFVERYGVELNAVFLSTSARQVTEDLRNNRGVETSAFVSPKGYYGLDFKWVPSYGKMTWGNRRITPFDLYLSIGIGATPTNRNTSESTFHLGTGQIFALSKGSAFRWDLSWFMYQSQSGISSTGTKTLFHNVLFSLGWSWFFPEATYR